MNLIRDRMNAALHDDLLPSMLNEWAGLAAGTERSLETALECMETALSIYPENLSYMNTQAHIYAALGRYERAVEIQEEVVRLVPEVDIYRGDLERFRQKSQGR